VSTEDAAFRITDSVFKSVNKKMCVGGIFCANHKILLSKLHFCGIREVYEDWIVVCLTTRRQKVEITSPNSTQKFFSAWGRLKHEVSQVSILGALLFILYMNDLPLKINSISEPILYGDDTGAIISRRDFEYFRSVLNVILSCMINYFAANNFVPNLYKTNIIKFTTKNSTHSTLHVGYKVYRSSSKYKIF
jgi:hypothetical protein